VSGNSVMSILFRTKREELTEEWIKLLNEDLNNLYSQPNIFSGDRIEKY
jgi:hypothetical protein